MHLPLQHQARLAGSFDDENEELDAQLQANSASHSHSHHSQEDDASQSQGSKGSGGDAAVPDGAPKPKNLPCPRCQSMNTKFCYYNNYSVNQPRHFCRNCQRYWTVGGTLRNVPVGGGSRKKHSRSRSRSDPYYRPEPNPSHDSDGEMEQIGNPLHPGLAAAAMAGIIPQDIASLHSEAGFPDFGELSEAPFHPNKIYSLLQLALLQNEGMYGIPGMPFTVGNPDHEQAELHQLFQGQAASNPGNLLTAAAAMMFMPELDPAAVALLHKATLWAEAQQVQAMARRQTAQSAPPWVEERECKPTVSAHMNREIAAMEELRHRQQAAAGSHRRPGFWETALMHSRPNKRQAWDGTKPSLSPPSVQHGSASTVDEESGNPVNASGFSHNYDDTSSWGSAGFHPGPDLYYQ
ncbi:uncharacterized protein [Physcomitrium patens]|uniref:Dof-type domain-containing protein n=1 Tax=Physcomitrium patens TaxID=3218 RepID=A9TBM0_PHYPA|nr:uncharacterized protein LOC112287144 [Physcomitrium patens]PNR47829.1 hypothetical protein PHYPA_012302 [Physcomitrium patens]|eukprot:XP_024385660.1 uncharacterized protein LOC112287144 [Physcomitrella patens]